MSKRPQYQWQGWVIVAILAACFVVLWLRFPQECGC